MNKRIYAEVSEDGGYHLVTDGQMADQPLTRQEEMQQVAQTRAGWPDDAPWHCGQRMGMVNGKYTCSKCGVSY